jgi:hypothetical protein
VRRSHANADKISVNYLGVPFAQQFKQPSGVAHRVNGILFIRRLKSVFKPVGDAWVRKYLFDSHTKAITTVATVSELDAQESNPKGYCGTAPGLFLDRISLLLFLNRQAVFCMPDIFCLGNVNDVLRDTFDQIDNLLQTPHHDDKVDIKTGPLRVLTDSVTQLFH